MTNKTLISIYVLLFISFGFAQNGKLLSKSLIDISNTPVWNKISKNNALLPDFEHLNTLNFYFITYQSDNQNIMGFLVEPKKDENYPVVIFNRGGNRNYGKLTVASMIRYTSKLAEQGYIILGSQYREHDEFGGQEINDVLSLTETVKEIDKANSNCIGMFGWSRGGMMTYLALQKSDNIKTAIVGNGVSDLFDHIEFRPKMETLVYAECIPDYWNNKASELKKRSAFYWANQLNKNSSLLILCGTNDKRVSPKQAEKLAHKLKAIKYDYELKTFDTDHAFSGYRTELNELVIEWFESRLKN